MSGWKSHAGQKVRDAGSRVQAVTPRSPLWGCSYDTAHALDRQAAVGLERARFKQN